MSQLYIGVMSGTSLDGIDISLCEISDAKCTELYFKEYEYDAKIKQDLLSIIAGSCSAQKLGALNYSLGLMYADALSEFIDTNKINKEDVIAIGLHGQTIWHEPNSNTPFSMQLGDASLVSKKVGIDVVSDFRSGDVALGGQGAPFAPVFHKFLFDDAKKNIAVLNLGGIANISILGEKLIGYDIGPANILLDLWIQDKKQKKYDAKGKWAKKGQVNEILLKSFLDEPYFKKELPKSTGRELFNASWLEQKLFGLMVLDIDVQATLLELSVVSIKNALDTFECDELLVCGGGAKNDFLMKRLEEELSNIEVMSIDAKGVRADSLEAMAFAWFAKKRIHKEKVALKDVTGATQDAILGAIYAKN